jgi:hypothetical protein
MIDGTLFELSDNGWVIWMSTMGLWTLMQIMMILAQAAKDRSARVPSGRPLAIKRRDTERDESTHRRSERR